MEEDAEVFNGNAGSEPEEAQVSETAMDLLAEEFTIATRIHNDGCSRDDTGWVAPIKTNIEPTSQTSDKGVLAMHFPSGTPLEELQKMNPPQEVLNAWKILQESWWANHTVPARGWSQELARENSEKKQSRQERRSKNRKKEKLNTKYGVQIQNENAKQAKLNK